MKKIFGIFLAVAVLFAGSQSMAEAGGESQSSSVSECVYDLLDGRDDGSCVSITFGGESIVSEDQQIVGTERFQGSDSVWRESPVYDQRFILANVALDHKSPMIVIITKWVGNGDLHGDIHYAWDVARNRVGTRNSYNLPRGHEFTATGTVTRSNGPYAPIFIVEVAVNEMKTIY